jgi:hypothetical protein
MRTHTILKLGTSSDAYRTRCGFGAVQVGDGLFIFCCSGVWNRDNT